MDYSSSFYRNKNVLVLEGGKMFGRSLIAQLLDQGAFVRTAVEHVASDLAHKNLETVSWNPDHVDDVAGIFKDMNIVFMTANKSAGAKVIKEEPHRLFMDNIRIQPKLMAHAVHAGVERVGFMSSSYIYPDTGKPNVEAEGLVGNPPLVNYGIGWCYRYLETLCRHFHMTSKTKFAILRPAAYYGPYDNFDTEEAFVIPALILKAVKQQNPFEVWGNGEDRRCFTYVDDLMQGFMVLVEKHAEADGVNICAAQSYTVKEVVAMILEILEHQPQIKLSTDKPSVIPYKVSDTTKAKKILDWEARTDLKDGLKRTINWYLQNHPVGTAK